MKKILLSTIVLFAFASSIILFEVSCKKTAIAQSSFTLTPATTSKLGGVIPDGTSISVDASGKISTVNNGTTSQNKIIYVKNIPLISNPSSGQFQGQIWIANSDGTNAKQISIVLPSGLFVAYTTFVKLSPDQKTIFFAVDDFTGKDYSFYSANIDGSNAKVIVPADGNGGTVEVSF